MMTYSNQLYEHNTCESYERVTSTMSAKGKHRALIVTANSKTENTANSNIKGKERLQGSYSYMPGYNITQDKV